MKHFDLILSGGTCLLPDPNNPAEVTPQKTDIGVIGGKIAAIGSLANAEANDIYDATDLHILPGLIDTQVHFREPGLEHKEDLASGTEGAVMGGITAVFEMPNTSPSTTSAEALNDKLRRASGRAWCDYAFYLGASAENARQLGELENLPGCCGIKIFMGSSTGSLLVDDPNILDTILANGRRRIAVHCEDEERLRERKKMAMEHSGRVEMHPVWRDEITALNATKRLVGLAEKHRRPVHVLHVTTADEMAFLKDHHSNGLITVECTPQHLTLEAPECYERLGTLAQMNPPVRDARHRQALWKAVQEGVVDVIGSDHAPHTLDEKKLIWPQSPSGMTGVQTTVPLMLNHVNEGRLTLPHLVRLLATAPARIFGLDKRGSIQLGFQANFTIVDMEQERVIENKWIRSKSEWTPFDGFKVKGWPKATILRGRFVMKDDELMGQAEGRTIEFSAPVVPS